MPCVLTPFQPDDLTFILFSAVRFSAGRGMRSNYGVLEEPATHQIRAFVAWLRKEEGEGGVSLRGVTPPCADDARHRETFGQPM